MQPIRRYLYALATVVFCLLLMPASTLLGADAARVVGNLTVTGLVFTADPGNVITKPLQMGPWSLITPQDSSTNAFFGLTGGNVGIGTATPSEQLELTGNLKLPATTATSGIIKQNGSNLMHTYGSSNLFVGNFAGNLVLTGAHNTGLGFIALYNNTTGFSNAATGTYALYSNTTGFENTAVGADSLATNTLGARNTGSGSQSLWANTTGNLNSAHGGLSLKANKTGSDNTAVGFSSLSGNVAGNSNTALGAFAGETNNPANTNTSGSNNLFLGYKSGPGTATQLDYATAIGAYALVSQSNSMVLGGSGPYAVKVGIGTETPSEQLELTANLKLPATSTTTGIIKQGNSTLLHTYGSGNLFAGTGSGNFSTTGTNNTAAGAYSLMVNTTGSSNTSFGEASLYSNTSGMENSVFGQASLAANSSGSYNTAVGKGSLGINTTGDGNTALGYLAGSPYTGFAGPILQNTTGSNNTFIGTSTGLGVAGQLTNATAIGYNARVSQNNSMVLGGTGADTVKVGIGTTTPGATLDALTIIRVLGSALPLSAWPPSGKGLELAHDSTTNKGFIQSYDRGASQWGALEINASTVTIGGTPGNLAVTGAISGPSLRIKPGLGNHGVPFTQGMIIKAIGANTSYVAGTVVARTDQLILERDGSYGGWRINYPVQAVGKRQTISCTGMSDSTPPPAPNRTLAFIGFINNDLPVGVTQVFGNSSNVQQFTCLFGNVYNAGEITEITVHREGSDYYWQGFMNSTYDQ